MIAAAKAIGYDRATFDRCEQLRVQPTAVGTDRRVVRAERLRRPRRSRPTFAYVCE
jgi:hypothetical protein